MPEKDAALNSLAIIGEEDLVLGFQAFGFKVYKIGKSAAQLNLILEEIKRQKFVVCLVEEDIYHAQEELFQSYRNLAPFIFIPFAKSREKNPLDKIIKDIRIRATGAF